MSASAAIFTPNLCVKDICCCADIHNSIMKQNKERTFLTVYNTIQYNFICKAHLKQPWFAKVLNTEIISDKILNT